MTRNVILVGDVIEQLATLPDGCVHMCVTSPPYWGLRDYGVDGQLGLEKTPEEFIEKMVAVFAEVKRVLRDDGTLWLNMGDSYWNGGAEKRDGGHGFVDGGKLKLNAAKGSILQRKSTTGLIIKPKNLCGIPWMLAFALRSDGWYIRQDIIWSKPNPMPESCTDRCTKAHEYIFLLTKKPRYFYDNEAIKEPAKDKESYAGRTFRGPTAILESGGRPGSPQGMDKGRSAGKTFPTVNKRSVWTIPTQPFPEAHFATFPPKLIELCILAGTSEKGCCEVCGTPWVRVVEKKFIKTGSERANITGQDNMHGWEDTPKGITESKTIGWEPGCDCNATVKPCIVLDPFIGAGTTGLVSRQLGRDWIGIELNPRYAAMATKRIRSYAPLFEE